MMNIKWIPEAYILQRWTKEARPAIVQDNNGKDITEDPKLENCTDTNLYAKNLLA
jgi:hypothetical protein